VKYKLALVLLLVLAMALQARDRLATHLAKTDRLANRFEAKRAATEHSAAG
jgi:hypothetical protein